MKEIKAKVKSDILPLEIINSLWPDKSPDSKKSLLKRACQRGDLIRVKNGLYLLGPEFRKSSYSSFEIANHILSPSYVSLESALSYYGLIPEAVYTTTSVTTKSSHGISSPVGDFSFSYLKTNYFNFGFYQVQNDDYRYLIATPLKALMDYIVLRQKKYKTVNNLINDLRFNFDEFLSYRDFVNPQKIDEMLQTYKSYRLQVILKELRKKL